MRKDLILAEAKLRVEILHKLLFDAELRFAHFAALILAKLKLTTYWAFYPQEFTQTATSFFI